MKKKLKILPLTLVLALSLTACSSGSEKTTEEVELPTNQVESSIDYNSEISISAEELSDSYRANEAMSGKEFRAVIAEVEGTIESINEEDGETFVTLLGHEKDKSPLVHCFFAEDVDFSELNVGDEITIIGEIAGKREIQGDRSNVVIKNSIFQ